MSRFVFGFAFSPWVRFKSSNLVHFSQPSFAQFGPTNLVQCLVNSFQFHPLGIYFVFKSNFLGFCINLSMRLFAIAQKLLFCVLRRFCYRSLYEDLCF